MEGWEMDNIIGSWEAKMRTYEGLVAASRASLSLLLVLPVDDRRRCLGPKLDPGTIRYKYFAILQDSI